MTGGTHKSLQGPLLWPHLLTSIELGLTINIMIESVSSNNSSLLSTAWVEQLALEEINMDETGIVHIDDHLNPEHLLEEASINFIDTIREKVDIYVSKFNEYRGGLSAPQIKTFKISNTVNDFMLFRNSLRLIFARKSNDTISIGFLSNGKDLFSARLSQNESAGGPTPHEIKAHLGPFHKISWKFQGEDIDIDALVKHYLCEFIRNSAR